MSPTQEQLDALKQLWVLADRHLGTSGGNTAAKFLLGLYNGTRFPFDLTNFRLLDYGNMNAAMRVLAMDWQPQAEVHEQLNRIYGVMDMGPRFELMAYDLHLKGRASKAAIDDYRQRMVARSARGVA